MQLGKYSGDVSRLGERGPGARDKKMQNLRHSLFLKILRLGGLPYFKSSTKYITIEEMKKINNEHILFCWKSVCIRDGSRHQNGRFF